MSPASSVKLYRVLPMIICCLLFLTDVCSGQQQDNLSKPPVHTVLDFLGDDGGVIVSIVAEIADTPEKRVKGLMFRKSMAPKSGMLFIYPSADDLTFWMRNTFISLDIIFVSQDFKVLNIAPHTRILSDTRYHSNGQAKYVIEVNAGFCEQHGISEGTIVRWK